MSMVEIGECGRSEGLVLLLLPHFILGDRMDV